MYGAYLLLYADGDVYIWDAPDLQKRSAPLSHDLELDERL